MAYEYAFVDSISASPTVRLDLARPTYRVLEGTDFAPPPLNRAVASTLLVDGDIYPAAAYGNRVLTLVIFVDADGDDAADAEQALWRELNRPSNVLRYRPDTTAPVFFKTLRAGPDSIVWDPVRRQVTVLIPAEPFALGLSESLGSVTINNDPAAVSNGQYADLTGIKGDVETPLRITATQLSAGVASDQMAVFAIRRRGTPSQTPFVLQAESMTQGTDTSVQAGSAGAEGSSGSGNNWSRTTFGTASATRLSISAWPTTDVPDVRGRYRVFARLRQTDGSAVISVGLRWGLSPTLSAGNPEVNVGYDGIGSTSWKLADLGLISLPSGADPGVDGLTGAALSARGQMIGVTAWRVSGTGNLDWDYLLFLPADDRLGVISWGSIAATGGKIVIDGTTETVYPTTSTGVVYGGGRPPSVTGWPMVSPGVTNRLFYLRTAGRYGPDVVGDATQMTIEYSPRYLYVRPVSS